MLKKRYSEEEEIDQTVIIDLKAAELQEFIFDKEECQPKDKRTQTYKKWKKEINEMMKEYNSKFGKIYSLIK